MHRLFPLVLSSLLLLLPVRAFTAASPQEPEEWQGSIGALWIQYPLRCAVWGNEEKRTFQCKQGDHMVDLTIRRPPTDPLLSLQGSIFGKTVDARAVTKGEILEVSGTYDNETPSLPITIGGTAQNFNFSGSHNTTTFHGNGSYTPESLHVSLSFTKNLPLTGTLDLRRMNDSLSSSSAPVEFSPSSGTGMALSATGSPTAFTDSTLENPSFPLLSSGTIERATQLAIGSVRDSGQSLMGFSRMLTLLFQAIFAVLVILILITFGFLLHHLKNQHASPPPSPPSRTASPKEPQ